MMFVLLYFCFIIDQTSRDSSRTTSLKKVRHTESWLATCVLQYSNDTNRNYDANRILENIILSSSKEYFLIFNCVSQVLHT